MMYFKKGLLTLKHLVLTAVLMLVPQWVFAQTLDAILIQFGGFLSTLFPLVVALSLFLFLYGMARFVFESGDEAGRSQGRQVMIWGVVALFVSVSLWAIVEILQGMFGLTADGACTPPQLNETNGGAVSSC